MELDQVISSFRSAANEFARGNPELVKALYSRRDDVTLANPFGPAVRGWDEVSRALDYASDRFRDGEVTDFETVARYKSEGLACILGVESWRAKVAGRQEISEFQLRVTSTYRQEEGGWKLVARHADPISAARPDGPIQAS